MSDGPRILPVFPLTGSLLLPGGVLPLHIFEPRYCAMVEDALEGERTIGMVQPRIPDPGDNQGPADGVPAPADSERDLYQVGCAGRIEETQELPYGRYVIVLRGVGRFAIRDELELHRGYRRVTVDYGPYSVDQQDSDAEIDGEQILLALGTFAGERGIEVDLENLRGMSGLALLNGLAMNLPFQPVEKQALLEAESVREREQMLLTLMVMGFDGDAELTH